MGSLVATLMSSAGPCYYALLGLDPQAYGGALAHLRSVNETVTVWALGGARHVVGLQGGRFSVWWNLGDAVDA